MSKLLNIAQRQWVVGLFLVAIVTLVTAQAILLGPKVYEGTMEYTHYNNFKMFVQSFFHLVDHKDLYQNYPAEYWDLFKYSPSFAVLMAPLAVLPVSIGLFIWNALNVLVLFFALWKLPLRSNATRLLVIAFILIELITSLQNTQSNGLIAGLVVMAFVCLEKKKIALASLFVVLTVFIKLFGIVAFALFLFYPGKAKAFAMSVGWFVLLAILPLLVVSWDHLLAQYQSWFHLLSHDFDASLGLSVAGWLQSWFHLEVPKNVITIVGAVLFLVPLARIHCYRDQTFKMLALASVLLWVVIFNHKAESPTFVIAVTGVAIWYFSQDRTRFNTVLLLLVLVFTILSPTDLFPRALREAYVNPYVLKVVPCILVWFKLWYDQWTLPCHSAVAGHS